MPLQCQYAGMQYPLECLTGMEGANGRGGKVTSLGAKLQHEITFKSSIKAIMKELRCVSL